MIDQDLDRPWVPENARPFKIGDRVRVRLSGECQRTFPSADYDSGKDLGKQAGHDKEEDGAIASVIAVFPRMNHGILVHYENNVEAPWGWIVESWFEPIELEHLDDEVTT